jgi:hypothetical protein
MSDLRESTRQTVHLAVLDRRDVVYLEILHAKGAPRLASRVGGASPLTRPVWAKPSSLTPSRSWFVPCSVAPSSG